jgi:hypothetical protein
MDNQTTMNTNGRARADEPNVVTGFSDLAHDVIELSELQARLAALDVAAAWQRMQSGAVLAIVGACALLGCIPVLLLTAAEALVEFAGWSRTLSLSLAGVSGLVLAGIVLAIAWRKLKTLLSTFDRSREELSRNVAWVKSSLRRKTAPGAGRIRRADRPEEVALPT